MNRNGYIYAYLALGVKPSLFCRISFDDSVFQAQQGVSVIIATLSIRAEPENQLEQVIRGLLEALCARIRQDVYGPLNIVAIPHGPLTEDLRNSWQGERQQVVISNSSGDYAVTVECLPEQ
jgi:hypothetical protein